VPSAAEMLSMDTLVSDDIRFMRIFAGFSSFYVNFRYICACLFPYAVLVKDKDNPIIFGEGPTHSNCVGTVSFACRAVNNPIKQLNKILTADD